MCGFGQGISVLNVEMVVVDVVEKHIDATEVVGRDVDLLTVESLPYIVFSEDFCELEEEGTRTATRIVDLVDFGLSDGRDLCEEFAHFLGSVELSSRFSCIGGVHCHQVFVCIAEGVNGIVGVVAESEVSNGIEEFDKLFVAVLDGTAELVGVHIEIVKKPLEVVFTLASLGGVLDVVKYP